jgi:hypothetical protein
MNYCQVEVDTAKYYREQEQLEAAQDAKEKEIEAKVNDFRTDYYWGQFDNMSEAIGETMGASRDVAFPFETKLAELVRQNQGDKLVEFLKKTSVDYWTKHLVGLVD